MSTENLKSSDPFVDERDPFTETEKVDPAIDVPDSEDPSKKTEKAGPAIDASHPRAPGGSKVPSRKGEKAGPTIEASHPRAPGGSEVPFTETEKADPSIDASHSRAPVSSEVPFTDVGPALDAKAPLEGDDDLGPLDPFHYEDPLAETADVGSTLDDIHIRIQQRNGRKTLTTLQGLPKEIKAKKLLKAFKKEFACNGTIAGDEKTGMIIQLQGDQRTKINNFLIEQGVPKGTIKTHGF